MIDPSFLKKKKSKWKYPVGALLFHILIIGGLILLEIHFRRELIRNEVARMLQVRPVTAEELQKIMSRAKIVDTEWIEEKDLVVSDDVKAYSGEKTQRVKEETRAANSGSVRGIEQSLQMTSKKIKGLKEGPFGRKLKISEKSKFKKGTYEFLDPSIKVSDKTILNTNAYIYASFANRMKESIAAAWTPRWRKVADKRKKEMSTGIYMTVTRIFIEKDGTVSNVSIDRSSGIPALDKAAKDSILEVRAFPNPPPDLFGPSFNGNFDFTFVISLVPGSVFCFNFLPDEKLDRVR
ncbi:MAG: TonB family protein [Bdellovibrionota bacterium]